MIVNMRRMRSPAGCTGIFSVFEVLVGFMALSFEKKINLTINNGDSERLDKTLSKIIPEELGLSRSRVKALIESGVVFDSNNKSLKDPALKVQSGMKISIFLPRPDELEVSAEKIKLNIVFEDEDLVVLNKPAGMVVHPAPGTPNGTLVNALLFHCGKSLSGIGGKKRPGIVHRIDKDTSGLLVIAKTQLAHSGLATQFYHHKVERKYLAFVHGDPSKLKQISKKLSGVTFESDGRIRISGRIGRHKNDRKKMTVHENSGRHAITRILVAKAFGTKTNRSFASLIECELETGRTHQIRVHLKHVGFGIIGDKVYRAGRSRNLQLEDDIGNYILNFNRQALHASTLGFYHPKSNEWLSFSSKLPNDMAELSFWLERFSKNA